MKKPIVALLLSLVGSGPGITAELALVPVPAAQKPGFDTIRERDLRADLGFIASDALLGRMSLQPGDTASIEWVAAEFAKIGLKPAASDEMGNPSYLQPVPLIEYRPDTANNIVTLKTGQSEQIWRAPNFICGFRDGVDLTAPLAFAGFGITAPGVS